MNRIVVIQARSGSSRLPGKALLEFHGMPLVVLAARRAASTGRNVLIATSDCSSDDALAAIAAQHGVPCYRGPLANVLGRFVEALENYPDNTIVTRLTSDNILPDGDLIDEVEEEFCNQGLEYISTTDCKSGLPYGVSVEITRLSHLREADGFAETDYDREHVTPYVIRKYGHAPFLRYSSLGKAGYRATVDCFDDFISLYRVFPEAGDAVKISWQALVERLPLGLFQPSGAQPVDRFVMGTAQIGMSYGIVNRSNPSDDERRAMIKTAIGNGVRYLDTARAYGRSETLIGDTLAAGWQGRCKVVTKLSPFAQIPEAASASEVRSTIENDVLRSCVSLKQRRLDTLLLHRVSHLTAWGGVVWRQLCDLQEEGWIGTLGVSVQSPEELMLALEYDQVAHIQLPYNILDQRWRRALRRLANVRAKQAMIVHARSALLQGLLLTDTSANWRRAHVSDATPVRSWLEGLVSSLGRESVSDLCLAWVRSQNWIDGVVVGSDNLAQLELNIRQFRNPMLSVDEFAHIESTRPNVTDETLDPSKWLSAGTAS